MLRARSEGDRGCSVRVPHRKVVLNFKLIPGSYIRTDHSDDCLNLVGEVPGSYR